jgi:4-methyl-5(b-hydroxyethyl)-thiazole monophosphate biosynthesis
MNKTALVILAHDFEEIEAVSPVNLLRRAGITVTVASYGHKLMVQGRSGLSLEADCLLDNIQTDTFDMLVLPGGPGVYELRKTEGILVLIKEFFEAGKWIGAICAAPLLLQDANILGSLNFTAHSSASGELNTQIPDRDVVRDGNLITSPGAGTAVSFGLALIEALAGSKNARTIADSIHANFSPISEDTT